MLFQAEVFLQKKDGLSFPLLELRSLTERNLTTSSGHLWSMSFSTRKRVGEQKD